MNNENVKEWLQLADDDLYSAKILNKQVRRPFEINGNDVNFAINSVEKVSLLKPIIDIRSEINKKP
jgi:hypothetical protein